MAAGAPRQGADGLDDRALFSDPRWRHNAIVGMMLAFSGVVGLWGIGFFSFDLFGIGAGQDLPCAGSLAG